MDPDVQRREARERGIAPRRAIRRGSGVASGPPARQASRAPKRADSWLRQESARSEDLGAGR
eukprot:5076754-Pleurochrysis_carterae.AAC.1